jgi:hypothetical protein
MAQIIVLDSWVLAQTKRKGKKMSDARVRVVGEANFAK